MHLYEMVITLYNVQMSRMRTSLRSLHQKKDFQGSSLNLTKMPLDGQCFPTPPAESGPSNSMLSDRSSPHITVSHYKFVNFQNLNDDMNRDVHGAESVKATVPWGDVVKNRSDFFDDTYWLTGVQLMEPSKMGKADVTTLLDFWYDRQQKHIQPTFCFKAWKDNDGDMETPSKSFLKAFRQATQIGKGSQKVQNRKAAVYSDEDEQSTDEEVQEEEQQVSTQGNEARSTSADSIRHQSPLPSQHRRVRQARSAPESR